MQVLDLTKKLNEDFCSYCCKERIPNELSVALSFISEFQCLDVVENLGNSFEIPCTFGDFMACIS